MANESLVPFHADLTPNHYLYYSNSPDDVLTTLEGNRSKSLKDLVQCGKVFTLTGFAKRHIFKRDTTTGMTEKARERYLSRLENMLKESDDEADVSTYEVKNLNCYDVGSYFVTLNRNYTSLNFQLASEFSTYTNASPSIYIRKKKPTIFGETPELNNVGSAKRKVSSVLDYLYDENKNKHAHKTRVSEFLEKLENRECELCRSYYAQIGSEDARYILGLSDDVFPSKRYMKPPEDLVFRSRRAIELPNRINTRGDHDHLLPDKLHLRDQREVDTIISDSVLNGNFTEVNSDSELISVRYNSSTWNITRSTVSFSTMVTTLDPSFFV